MASQTSTSTRITPVKAIPSNLAAKTSPSIPPPSQTFEPLVKAVLRHRLVYNIFLQSALLTWAVVTLTIVWQQSLASLGLSGLGVLPFRPLSIIGASFIWVFVALPAAVVRKALLTSTRTPATSPASTLSIALSKPSIRRAIVAYMVPALIMVVIHAFMAYSIEPADPKLRIFVKSKKHPHYLNGRALFLVISQIAVAICYAARNIMLDRFVFKWNLTNQSDDYNPRLNLLELLKAAIISTILSTLTLPFTATIFALGRLLLPILYSLPLVSSSLKPFTAHFLRSSWVIFLPLRHVDLIRRAWYLGFITLFIWETSDSLFEVNVAKPIPVSYLTADPNQTLVSGISSTDMTFRYFAYSELRVLAEDKAPSAVAQRTALFSDQKHNPTLWARLLRESLLLLGKDYQLFLRRGKPEPPAAPAPSPKPNLPENLIPSSPVPLLRRRIFKSGASNGNSLDATLDVLGSDGPITKAVDSGVNTVDLPEIFRSAEVKAIPTVTKKVEGGAANTRGVIEIARQNVEGVVRGAIAKYTSPGVREQLEGWLGWWKNERTNKVVDRSLPYRELDIVVVEVISHLTCASLSEDRYGVVQKDIPRILEAFLSFLSAVEEYQIDINTLYVAPKAGEELSPKELQEREKMRYEVEKTGEVLGTMADGLKEGVARIVRTFGEKLLAFKFPPRTAQKLQGFLDYC